MVSAMEGSVRMLNSSTLNRHLLLRPRSIHSATTPFPPYNRNRSPPLLSRSTTIIKCVSRPRAPPPSSNPFSLLLSLSGAHNFHSAWSPVVGSDAKEKSCFSWNRGNNGRDLDPGLPRDKGTLYTVVILGWLGSEQKHLKRYIELYTSKGIHALSFVVPVRDVLGFDLGRRVENRISALTHELISWLSLSKQDGTHRSLIFHTFSNTGWLVYGAILDHLQSSGEFVDKIKGCVVDSGPDPELNPKVWAAGFSAALLKKRSSATLPSVVKTDKVIAEVQNTEPILVETFLLSILEKFFYFIFKLPDVNRRLSEIITTLSKNQPPCPQLYLYSTADKVIPFGQVDTFIHGQKMLGMEVWACNFGSSPHVDHYRTFPREYSAELNRFLEHITTLVH